MTEIAKNIKKLRKENGLSQEEFAEKINAVRQSVSKWERGKTNPTLDTIELICKEFNVTSEELMGKNKTKIERLIDKIGKRRLEKIITITIATLFILFIILTTIKLFMLNHISNKISDYCKSNNYYFEINMYENNILKENQKVWYLDGKYKISDDNYRNTGEKYVHTDEYIDIKNNKYEIRDDSNNEFVEIENADYLEIYKNEYSKTQIPQCINNEQSVIEKLSTLIKSKIFYKQGVWNIKTKLTSIMIKDNKNLLITETKDSDKYKFRQNEYFIILNCVSESDVNK